MQPQDQLENGACQTSMLDKLGTSSEAVVNLKCALSADEPVIEDVFKIVSQGPQPVATFVATLQLGIF